MTTICTYLCCRAGTGKRIATALMTDARVQASLTAADVRASGSLGGLQILNLLSVSPVHQRIVSVGREPLIEEYQRQHQVGTVGALKGQ